MKSIRGARAGEFIPAERIAGLVHVGLTLAISGAAPAKGHKAPNNQKGIVCE